MLNLSHSLNLSSTSKHVSINLRMNSTDKYNENVRINIRAS